MSERHVLVLVLNTAFGTVISRICKETAKFTQIDRDNKQILSYISE